MNSHADPNPAGWTDEEWAGMLRDAEAEVDSLKAENQQLREALAAIIRAGRQPLDSMQPTSRQMRERGQAMMDIAVDAARAAVGEE